MPTHSQIVLPSFLAIATLALGGLAACSTTPEPDGTFQNSDLAADGKDSKDPPAKGPTSSPTTSPSSGGAQPPPSTKTNDEGDDDDEAEDPCSAACEKSHAAGTKKLGELETKEIACTCAASVCATQCGQTGVCKEDGADPKDGDACAQCLEGAAASQCSQQTETACNADSECAAAMKCYEACEPPETGDDDDGKGDDDDTTAQPN